jgi:uncharacterized protein YndB with AHSA1/START domain
MDPVEVRVERTVVVPVDVVWQIIEAAETLPSWLPICERCDLVSGQGAGRRQRMHVRWGRKAAEIDQQVIEYVPCSRLSWKHVAERIDGKPAPRISTDVTMTIELHPAGAGTRIVLTSKNVPSGVASALMLRVVAAPRIRKSLTLALENLSRSSS